MRVQKLRPSPREVSLERFSRELGADVAVPAPTTCLLGFSAPEAEWLVSGFLEGGGHGRERLDPLVRFLDRYVRPHLATGSFWMYLDHWDAWRETTASEELPALPPSRPWVACYGARRGDPTALLVPEAHYLASHHYRPRFTRLALERVPWRFKRGRAIFAGGDHGPATGGTTPRRRLRGAAHGLPIDVRLGQSVSRRAQIAYKYLLDVDGWVRTWDAWAWKLASGSVVLSPASDWTTFFTELFEPWEHFVPVAEDFSNLEDRLAWCLAHDDECRAIARRARARVGEVYRPEWAGARLAAALREKLGDPVSVAS